MLHHTSQALDQPSAQVGKEIWELKVSGAFIFRGNQQFWLPSLWVHSGQLHLSWFAGAVASYSGSQGLWTPFRWEEREWVALPLLKNAAQEGRRAWSPEAPQVASSCHCWLSSIPETRGPPAPRAVMGHSSCTAALPVSPVGCIQGWDGLEWVAAGWNPVWEVREGAEQLLSPFPPAVGCRKHPERSQVPPAPTPFRPGVCLVERVKGDSR